MKSFFSHAKGAIVLLSIFTLIPCTMAFAAESITVTSFGGAFSTSQIEAYQKPFMKKTGVTVNAEVYNGGLAEIRAQVQSGNVTWDLVDVEKQDLTGGCDEGLFEQIDPAILAPAPDGTPAAQDFLPGAIHECGVATIVWTTIVAYDKTKFPGEKPSKLADFFDAKKFPGMRGISKRPVPDKRYPANHAAVRNSHSLPDVFSDRRIYCIPRNYCLCHRANDSLHRTRITQCAGANGGSRPVDGMYPKTDSLGSEDAAGDSGDHARPQPDRNVRTCDAGHLCTGRHQRPGPICLYCP